MYQALSLELFRERDDLNRVRAQLTQAREDIRIMKEALDEVSHHIQSLRHSEKRYKEVGKTHYAWDKMNAELSAIERALLKTQPKEGGG